MFLPLHDVKEIFPKLVIRRLLHNDQNRLLVYLWIFHWPEPIFMNLHKKASSVQWSLYFKTSHGTFKMLSYLAGDLNRFGGTQNCNLGTN